MGCLANSILSALMSLTITSRVWFQFEEYFAFSLVVNNQLYT